jgi:ribosomal protein L20
MPRSVNSVAKEQEEKIMKLAKGYFGRQNVWTVAKNAVEKQCATLTVTEK